MNLQEKIDTDIKKAMLTRNAPVLLVLRQLKSAITNAALVSGNVTNAVADADVLAIVRKQIKQREDSIEQFKQANRLELVEQEALEIKILEEYLPTQLTDSQIDAFIKTAIEETGAVTKKDMGKAIKRAQELIAGATDNKTISGKIAQLLK